MATIIRFPAEIVVWREAARQALGTERSSSGKIVMFTGVRYARHDDDTTENGTTGRPKRKRRVKV